MCGWELALEREKRCGRSPSVANDCPTPTSVRIRNGGHMSGHILAGRIEETLRCARTRSEGTGQKIEKETARM